MMVTYSGVSSLEFFSVWQIWVFYFHLNWLALRGTEGNLEDYTDGFACLVPLQQIMSAYNTERQTYISPLAVGSW